MLRILLSFILIFSVTVAHGQAQSGESEESSVVERYGPRRQISTIVYMGLAGDLTAGSVSLNH